MGTTGIEWTATQNEDGSWSPGKTWNPVVGCTKVSEGCRFCYAKTLHDQRHKAYGEGKRVPAQYAKPFESVQLMSHRLGDPFSWKKPQRVFVNSVSDLFHEDVPFEFIATVFGIMQLAERHTFQVLTKRPERMRAFFETHRHWSGEIDTIAKTVDDAAIQWAGSAAPNQPAWPLPNVWLGTSVENQAAADERIPHLLATPAAVRFLSCEPLLGPVNLKRWFWEFDPDVSSDIGAAVDTPAGNLNWVIVGGESGPGARPMQIEWARSLVAQCKAANVACFVKQMGARPTGDYYDDHEGYENRGIEWPDATGWSHRDGQPPVGSRVALPLADKKGGNPEEWPEDLRVRQFPVVG